jgi:DNA-binding LytR/AlgR family response regulator
LYRYFKTPPKFIITTKSQELAYEAIKYQVFDYLTKPLDLSDFRKTILKFDRNESELPRPSSPEVNTPYQEIERLIAANGVATENETISSSEIVLPIVDAQPETITQAHSSKTFVDEKPLVICVKSYGDYRFINADDICYLQADNNSTDIHLNNGEMITAFKTLKHFETVLNSPFVRIHNSYIVNIDYVSRIHTGNAVCYIKNTTTKLPFSKSYKENVDAILNSITKGNYLEI